MYFKELIYLCTDEQRKTFFTADLMKLCICPRHVIYANNHFYATFDIQKQLYCTIIRQNSQTRFRICPKQRENMYFRVYLMISSLFSLYGIYLKNQFF